jgi:hypothetical protein
MGTPNRKPPDQATRKRISDDVALALRTICRSWNAATNAAAARGYGPTSTGPETAPGIVREDPKDPLHARQMAAVHAKASARGDRTGNAAVQLDNRADDWLKRARVIVLWLLSLSAAGERQLTGPFNPPTMEAALSACVADLVDLWPLKFGSVVDRVYALANEAKREWPVKMKVGETDGDVKVGGRAPTLEMCAECKQPVTGGAVDPISRMDGKPYHRTPCYNTAYQRRRRKVAS